MGRADELVWLHEALSSGSGRVLVRAVRGLGGVGKTTLAARYVERYGGEYTQVVWVSADSSAAVTAGLVRFALALEPELTGELPGEALAERALGWLAAHTGWLVVLDDVADPALVRPLAARAAGGRFVATSRRATGWAGVAEDVALDVLGAEAARVLFEQTLGTGGARLLEGVDELCGRLGFLPLALAQAAAFMAERRVSAARYLELMDAQPALMLEDAALGTAASATVARTWAVTLDALADDPVCGDVLRTLAFFATDGIAPELLSGCGEETEVLRAVGSLRAYSLIEDAEDGGLSVHRLVQQVARTPDQKDPHRVPALIEAARERAMRALYDLLPGDPYEPGNLSAWRAFAPHVLAFASNSRPRDDDATVAFILDRTATHLQVQGYYAAAVVHFERASDAAERLDPDGTDMPLASRNNLAVAYRYAGRVDKAIALFEAVLAVRERVLGLEHPSTLTSRNNLALAYQDAGRVDEAIALHEADFATFERIRGAEHPHTLTSRNNLATAYRDAGRVDEAIALFEVVLAVRERILGAEHPNTLTSCGNLADAYRDAGRVHEAIVLHEVVLAARERILGSEHPDTLTSRNNLALAYQDAGRVDEAIVLHEAELAACERVLGAEHPDTLTSRGNLALAYRVAGRLDEALPLFEAVFAARERDLGPDHPNTALVRQILSDLSGTTDEIGKA